MNSLEEFGWNEYFAGKFESFTGSGLEPGRIAVEHKQRYGVYSEFGELTGEVTGKLLYSSDAAADLPKVGDWVVISVFESEKKAIINEVLDRRTKFSRKTAGKKTEEQVIAANIDLIFIVQGLDNDFNPNRLERYMVMAAEGGADASVILNKADLCDDPEAKIAAVKERDFLVPILGISARTGDGIEQVREHIRPGMTAAFIGSSGVGKSTIINRLIGEERQKTFDVREDDSRGRHTTTKRELILLPGGGILVDTSGMREIQLWSADEGVDRAFTGFEQYAGQCRYDDCTHMNEPGCAVLEAVAEGKITREQYDNYVKLQKEMHYLKTKQDYFLAQAEKKKWKQIHKDVKKYYKNKK